MQILLPAADGIFQNDNASILAAELVQSWFDNHEDEVKYLYGLAQSPDINIIESECLGQGGEPAARVPQCGKPAARVPHCGMVEL
ncbi:hypothetical protein TNCV_3818301 [Trichonephila clavipes]|nr:hypothetical protein TNCV_3818301 [Trichonephila clavipes]